MDFRVFVMCVCLLCATRDGSSLQFWSIRVHVCGMRERVSVYCVSGCVLCVYVALGAMWLWWWSWL